MSFKEHDKKTFIADACADFTARRISKRDFMRKMAMGGIGFSAFASSFLGAGRPFRGLTGLGTEAAQAQTPPDVAKWLKDVGGKYKGTKIRYSTEATPPSIVANQLAKEEFTPLTGIEVEVEIVPLEQVLQKATLDVQGQLGTYDVYYLDQSWTANFINDTIDPREYFAANKELQFPDFDWADFSKELINAEGMYKGKLIGIPFDIPIAILMYRKDLQEKYGLKTPTTMAEYLNWAKTVNAGEQKNGIYGSTGEMKSGHYSLECDWTIWLWGNGGSVFNKANMFSGNDERGLAAMEYWKELKQYMPPAVTTWTWDGQGQSVTQGQAASLISWGEFFPGFDGKDSKVVGLMEAAIPPKENPGRRPASDAGFGEIPAIGHQGGSTIALSKYSKNKEAAWIFLQWATSKDVVARSALLGGGASPVRSSAFTDPRVLANAKVGPGTTRHFPAIDWTIKNAMGSEPKVPSWVEMSNNVIPVELGKYWAGEYKSAKECLDVIAKQCDELAKPFRT